VFSKILTAHEQDREKGSLPQFAVVAIVLAIVIIVIVAAIIAIAAIAAFADPKQIKRVSLPLHSAASILRCLCCRHLTPTEEQIV
jgi:hypothetical protein